MSNNAIQTSSAEAGSWRYDAYHPAQLNFLGVVIKVVERCNIDCTYCHVFNSDDASWRSHPKHISMDVMQAIARFLERGIEELGLSSVRIVFQGGEPMMMRTRDFDASCEILRNALRRAPGSEFVMQTNATLINDEWLDLIARHRVAVGVSLDGPAEVHDRRRVDHRGKGTYTRVIRGLTRLQEAAAAGRAVPPSALAVIDPESSAPSVYRHLVHTLGLDCVNFLLPKNCYENRNVLALGQFGAWLAAAFEAWVEDDNPEVEVPIFVDILDVFLHQKGSLLWGNATVRPWESAICIASNGDIAPDDDFRVTHFWGDVQGQNVRTSTLADFLDSRAFHILNRARRTVPTGCNPCLWKAVCGGGVLVNRYSSENSFDNPSILCRDLQQFYASVATYLARSGISRGRLARSLDQIVN
jgi:uncharacterized protein